MHGGGHFLPLDLGARPSCAEVSVLKSAPGILLADFFIRLDACDDFK